MKILHRPDYREKRKEEYPAIGDQLDAIWKALAGRDLPPEATAIRDKVLAVKEKYSKNR